MDKRPNGRQTLKKEKKTLNKDKRPKLPKDILDKRHKGTNKGIKDLMDEISDVKTYVLMGQKT